AKGCLKAIRDEFGRAELSTQPVTNEANVFHKFGVEALVFGPGEREGNAHTCEESVDIDSLNKAIKIYESVIENTCIS
ncbi:MAG: M20/M25/M40 family metallo-hydrolase, partial [Pseudomonadota bacterium]